MKIGKILILIDLGEETPSLLRYGFQLAQTLKANVWVQHIYYIPPDLVGEVFIPSEALKKYEKKVFREFKKLKKGTLSEIAEPHFIVSHGDLVEKANQLIDQENIDLVVVGNQGGGLSTNILGSNTLKLIHHAHCQVLSVPKQAEFKPFMRMAFATDWQDTSATLLQRIKDFVQLFNAHLDIIHVSEKHERREVSIEVTGMADLSHTFYYHWAKDVEEGLQQHVAEYQNDLIVLIPHHHDFFDRLFRRSVTRQMVFHSHVPLLTLHESFVSQG